MYLVDWVHGGVSFGFMIPQSCMASVQWFMIIYFPVMLNSVPKAKYSAFS